MQYFKVSDYMATTRIALQDTISPYRYTDSRIIDALNSAMFEISRMRADIFLDAKYQHSVATDGSNYGDMIPQLFTTSKTSATVPVPSLYRPAVEWYMSAWLQFDDVEDAQDQRAQAFMQKFAGRLSTFPG